MSTIVKSIKEKGQEKINLYRKDPDGWNMFIHEILKVDLDEEQKEIVRGCQHNRMVSVASGTARGKDFTAACIALAFLYLTPLWDPKQKMPNGKPKLTANTKVFMTAPTDRQVGDIMYPDIVRHFNNAGILHGRQVAYDIRTDWEEWFLTGFKADEHKTESWTGLHAVNICFIVTEGSGIAQKIFEAIEGNLQGNSLLLVIFNPNVAVGYAAESQKSARFKHFRLNSLNAPNVLAKKMLIPGQVDWEWVNDKVHAWCKPIGSEDIYSPTDGDFEWEGIRYRPNDLFRVKVQALFPKISDDVLIPLEWVELAHKNYAEWKANDWKVQDPLRLGVDIAGMGRDSSVLCPRYGNWVPHIEKFQSGGTANHMEMVGRIKNRIASRRAKAFVDTIGEGAGVYSRCDELGLCKTESKDGDPGTDQVYSVKGSEGASDDAGEKLKDITGEYKFANMRAYLAWAVRDWLNPVFNGKACLPPDDDLTQELTGTRYKFRSDGSIIIEPKEDIKKRINRSPDKFDGLAHTFYPVEDAPEEEVNVGNYFF
jgi:hypothetical protein